MIIHKIRFLSLALQIEEQPERHDKLRRALRVLENLKPNVTQEKTTDEAKKLPSTKTTAPD